MDLMVGEMKIFEMNGGREGQPFRTECSDHDGAKFFRMLSKFCAASLKGYLGSRRVMNAGCNGHGARRERWQPTLRSAAATSIKSKMSTASAGRTSRDSSRFDDRS